MSLQNNNQDGVERWVFLTAGFGMESRFVSFEGGRTASATAHDKTKSRMGGSCTRGFLNAQGGEEAYKTSWCMTYKSSD